MRVRFLKTTGIQSSSGTSGRKPVSGGQTFYERHKVCPDLLRCEDCADSVQRFDSLIRGQTNREIQVANIPSREQVFPQLLQDVQVELVGHAHVQVHQHIQ